MHSSTIFGSVLCLLALPLLSISAPAPQVGGLGLGNHRLQEANALAQAEEATQGQQQPAAVAQAGTGGYPVVDFSQMKSDCATNQTYACLNQKSCQVLVVTSIANCTQVA